MTKFTNLTTYLFFAIAGIYTLMGVYLLFYSSNNSPKEIQPLQFSKKIGQWSGLDIPMDNDALNLISPDDMVFRLYQNPIHKSVTLYVGLYSDMDRSDLAHSPLVCYTGQGWSYNSNGVLPIALGDPYGAIDVSSITIEKENNRQIVWYWFQSKNYSSDSLFKMRVKLFIDKLIGRDTKNAFIRISVPIDPDDEKSSKDMLHRFFKQTYLELYEYFREK